MGISHRVQYSVCFQADLDARDILLVKLRTLAYFVWKFVNYTLFSVQCQINFTHSSQYDASDGLLEFEQLYVPGRLLLRSQFPCKGDRVCFDIAVF